MNRATNLPTPIRFALPLIAAGALIAALLAINAATVWTLGIAASALFVWGWRTRRDVTEAIRRLDSIGPPGSPSTSLEASVEAVERRVAALNHRLAPAHPVSGLPMREALLERMQRDRNGIFGAVKFMDFDRLNAFDPELGERVFSALATRLQAMVKRDRLAVQVDRGIIGLWFGATSEESVARAELEAIAYALGEEIADACQTISPQIRTWLGRYDAEAGQEAGAFLSRTLASFVTAEVLPGADQRDPIDYEAVARDQYALEQDLRRAIVRRELRLEFQPLIDASAGRVSGAEALIRWDSPERGTVSPASFIPVVEAIGMASEVGTWALNAAARQAKIWVAEGLGRLRIAVNVSGIQLERDDLPIIVRRTLDRHDLGSSALEIELTESVATSEAEHCRAIFGELSAMGIKLAVDDFGTGYSGFSSLRSLTFDKIKIDREFVASVDTRTDSQAICQSIIALGRGLGIRVLAEGVERREEYEWLRRHGCHHFQGFYFGRPMRPDAFAAFVRDEARMIDVLRLGISPAQIEERLRA